MISVIVPVYNVEKYISKCLDSLVSQTYKNSEIIIINDGSTDKSEFIIKQYLEKYNNIIYVYQENKGVAEARNTGLRKSSGDYVLFVDSDDYIEKNMAEKMYSNAKKYDADVVVCGHIKFYENKYNKNEVINYDGYQDSVYNGNQVLDLMLSCKVKGFLWDKLFRRSRLIKNGFVLESNRYIEDWFPVIKQIRESRIITFINEPLYHYRQRDGSALHNINKKLLDDYIYTIDKINNYLNSNSIEYNKACKNVFDCEAYYSVIRYYYLNYYSNEGINKENIYKAFSESNYPEHIKFSYRFFVNKGINIRLKLKVLLWQLKIFHLFYNTNKIAEINKNKCLT